MKHQKKVCNISRLVQLTSNTLICVTTARFLHRLGLRRFPPLKDLVGYCASIESSVRVIALAYLLDNFVTQYSESYDPVHFIDVPFIPALDKNSTFRIGTLTEVITFKFLS